MAHNYIKYSQIYQSLKSANVASNNSFRIVNNWPSELYLLLDPTRRPPPPPPLQCRQRPCKRIPCGSPPIVQRQRASQMNSDSACNTVNLTVFATMTPVAKSASIVYPGFLPAINLTIDLRQKDKIPCIADVEIRPQFKYI